MSHAMGVRCPACGTQTVPEDCPEGCPIGHGSTYDVCDTCAPTTTPTEGDER